MTIPTIPAGTLSGIVPYPFAGRPLLNPEGLDMGVDGHWIKPRRQAVTAAVFDLDTTTLADGDHLVQFSQAQLVNGAGVVKRVTQDPITTANGKTMASYPLPPVTHPLLPGQAIPSLPGGFMLSMFNLSAAELVINIASVPCKAAGLNTFEDESWPTPHLIPPPGGWRVLALGDNLCRTPALRAAWQANPNSAAMAAAVVKTLAASGQCVGMLGPDESNAVIGNPADPVVLAIQSALRGQGLPLAWPITISSEVNGPAEAAGWTAPSIADFSCVYHDTLDQYLYHPLERRVSMSQVRDRIRFALGCCPPGAPRVVLIQACGASYQRRTPGSTVYQPGDVLLTAPWTPAQILCQVGVALVHGACGLRYWGWDSQGWQNARKAAAIGSDTICPEGTSPTLGADRWNAITLANAAIVTLAPLLLGAVEGSVYFGSDWECCGRRTATGHLFLAVNCCDRALPIPPLPVGYTSSWTLTPAGRIPNPVAGQPLSPGGWVVLQA